MGRRVTGPRLTIKRRQVTFECQNLNPLQIQIRLQKQSHYRNFDTTATHMHASYLSPAYVYDILLVSNVTITGKMEDLFKSIVTVDLLRMYEELECVI